MKYNQRKVAFNVHTLYDTIGKLMLYQKDIPKIMKMKNGLMKTIKIKMSIMLLEHAWFGGFTLMLLVDNLANTKWCKKPEKWLKPWQMGTHWKYSSRALQWIPTWQGSDVFRKFLHHCALDECSLSIGRVRGSFSGFTNLH